MVDGWSGVGVVGRYFYLVLAHRMSGGTVWDIFMKKLEN